MEPLEYCRDKAARDGTAGYYRVLFFAPPARAGLVALHALELELAEAVEDCSEPGVARHKLAFWRQELARLHAGTPAHPVARALARHAPGALTPALAARLLDGVSARLDTAQIRNGEELDRHCRDTAGSVGQAAAQLLSAGDGEAASHARSAAAAAERVRLLAMPRRAGLPPHGGVPLDRLTASGATPRQVDAGGAAPALASLRRALVGDARAALEAVLRALPRRRGYAATRAAIALAQLHALERGGYSDSGCGRAAPPLALLWHAWRHRP